ncbi:Trans-acting regulatory protein HvrA [Thauera sp. GDN1]|uniref:H-NS histone family protein n=1 Tax=Thauera sp. GDN1 TaxID=2944810 RepID=UPI00247A91E0|nr:H-NS histone family protein [Thauera sp. GDN1]WEN43329.1 Trans-acting regulatory protein HvrA [Thauera sp. GDN1]
MDLSTYTLPELRRLQAKVEAEIRRRSDVTRRNLLKRMQKMAADEGLSLDELLVGSAPASAETKPAAKRGQRAGAKATKAAKPAPVIKYRNPTNPDQGWSGRGRKPQWALDWIAQGKPIEELAA